MWDTAAPLDADADLNEPMPVRSMIRTWRCGPLLSDEHNGAELELSPLLTRMSQHCTAKSRPEDLRNSTSARGAVDVARAPM